MNEIILNYIIQAILGGASGYITNDYAINMLFKEYTPLKIGGVIKKTRTEFIENISLMVENDIINKDKLIEILSDENFKTEFDNLALDFFQNSLYESTANKTFSDVSNFDSTIKSLDVFIEKSLNEHMVDVYSLISNNLKTENFLNEEQLNYTTNSAFSILTDILKNSDIIEKLFLEIYENNNNIALNTVIDKNIYNTVIGNSFDILKKLIQQSNSQDIAEILNAINLDVALNELKVVLYKRKLKDVVNLNDNFINNINDIFLSYLNSENGTLYLKTLIVSLFDYGKNCNKTIFELLDSKFEDNLKDYLIQNIPLVTENIITWINENSNLINYLIKESIDEVINESDGLKAKILSVIKNTFMKDLGDKFSITNKIISYVEKVAEPEKLSQTISAKIIDVLSNLTIKEIIIELENNNINSENIASGLLTYINENSKTIIQELFNKISEVELSKILPNNLVTENLKLILANKLKDFISSDIVLNKLSINSTLYIENVLSKDLSSLVTEEKAKNLAISFKEFIINKINENELLIKKFAQDQIKIELLNYNSIKLNSNIINQLNSNVKNYYQNILNELGSTELSVGLDKLNSIDNLASNSSETLRSYAIKNTDAILSGTVKAIVSENLTKLSDDELVDFANDFIGRELKPIMFFGGVLGVIAGVLLASFQSKATDFGEVSLLTMAVYSFVGYITNVIAINMIFKPYKENKFLSKIPFFRNFSLGYIVKNQRKFAKNTSYFIDNSLLSKKSINELFDKYKEKIKYSFNKSISNNNYIVISNLLEKYKHSVVKNSYMFLVKKLSLNINKISNALYNKLSKIKLLSVLNDKYISDFSYFIFEKSKEFDFHKSVYNYINSKRTVKDSLPAEQTKNYINNIQNKYYDEVVSLINNKDFNILLNYETNYQQLINKNVNEFISESIMHNLSTFAANKICENILPKDSRDKLTKYALNLINSYVDRNKTFEELFDGKFKVYVNKHVPKTIDKVSESIKTNIINNKSVLTLSVQSEIKNNLGFIEKSMYSLMGGDEIIAELLTKIITIKVPKFIDDKKQEVSIIASNVLEERLYKAKVDVLFTGIDKIQITELMDNYLTPEISATIEDKINKITSELFIKVSNIKVSSITQQLNINNLKDILSKYENEIDIFSNSLSLSLNNKVEVMDSITKYTNSISNEFLNHELKSIFNGISFEEISNVTNTIVTKVYENNLNEITYSSLKDLLNYQEINIGELINKDEFVVSTDNFIASLLDNSDFDERLNKIIENIITEAISTNFSFIDSETKEYLLNVFTKSSINSLKGNLDEILRAVEFDKIAKEEIEKMEPRRIHEMFNSFGEKYFKRLMLYGFGGFIFGINVYVGMLLTAIKIISEIFKKKD